MDIRAEKLGQRIRRKIRESGLTQAEFAERLGMTPSRLSNYVTGARLPDVFTLSEIADSLGLPIDYFCGRCSERSLEARKYVLTVYGDGQIRLADF